jgi:type II secretory ATPase GspE/PulE/Tfp pilus assembly ATPase PilB-like protein
MSDSLNSPRNPTFEARESSSNPHASESHVATEKADATAMAGMGGHQLRDRLRAVDVRSPERVSRLVHEVLDWAVQHAASDVHFEPTFREIDLRMRIDGVLARVATLPLELGPNLVARLKVLADLLTYRVDVPQEGRIADASRRFGVEMRVSSFPTIHGEKVVVRVFDPTGRTLDLDQLGLRSEHQSALMRLLAGRNGAILLTGPSGSGKTTTIYACLRHLVGATRGSRHVVTIEDPVEQVIEGVTQAQARPGTEFDFARGLRSLLRQDPEVIMIGEIRDAETAAIAIEAALTGHLVISTLHAGSACGVVGRLLDMGIEPYLLTSGLTAVLNQRLVRRRCAACASPVAPGCRSDGSASGAAIRAVSERSACPQCAGTGYRGRVLLTELITLDEPLRRGILSRGDTATLEAIAGSTPRQTIAGDAARAVAEGLTTWDEIARVLGPIP